MKKRVVMVALLLTLTIAAAGCTKKSEETNSNDTNTESTDSTEETDTTEEQQNTEETEDAQEEGPTTSELMAEIDVAKCVTLGEYKGITVKKTIEPVTDEDVEKEIQTALEDYPVEVNNRSVQEGDTVDIDYVGRIDGEEFEGGSDTGFDLQLGSHSFIDGFEDGLIGVKPGEKKTLNLKFPDDYKTNPDLSGKAVVFDVTVNYIEGDDIVPELTDDFVKGLSITDVSTVDEYRAYVKSQLQTNKESEAESSKQKELLQQAVDNAEIKELPEELVTEYSAQYTSYYQQYASYFGMEFSDFLTQYMNQTEDDFNKDAADYGKQVAGNMLVVCAIAKAEKIDPDALYDEKVAQYAKQSGYSDVATLEKDYSQKYLRQVIINEEVLNVLEENAVAVAPTETESEASK